MVRDTVGFLRAEGRRVFLDCEHFFDGYKHDPDYGVRVLDAALEAGADVGRACATPTAACCPMGVHEIVTDGARPHRHPARHPHPGRHGLRGGQHPGRRRCRRDARAGHRQRLRRAGRQREHLRRDRRPGHQDGPGRAARRLPARDGAGLARHRRDRQSRAGHPRRRTSASSAFAHKAGLHASAIKVSPRSCTTTSTRRVVGNDQRILVTEMAGRASVELKIARARASTSAPVPTSSARWSNGSRSGRPTGWSYEAADASFELLVRDELGGAADAVRGGVLPGDHRPSRGRRRWSARRPSRSRPTGKRVISTEEGNGPVNALDRALR